MKRHKHWFLPTTANGNATNIGDKDWLKMQCDCGAAASMGDSNDEPAVVQQEMLAAELLSVYYIADRLDFEPYDYGDGAVGVDSDYLLWDAWPWDPARPVAEQYAELEAGLERVREAMRDEQAAIASVELEILTDHDLTVEPTDCEACATDGAM